MTTVNSESSLVLELWELVRDGIPSARRADLALSMLRSFEEFGFEAKDLADLLDEDDHLTAAYRALFGHDGDEDDSGDSGWD
jgi:hypothetical protein